MIKVSSYICFIRSSLLYESNKGVSNLNKSISLKEIYILQHPAKISLMQWLPQKVNQNSKFLILIDILLILIK